MIFFSAPPPPANFQVTRIGITSIEIQWTPPNPANGILRHYIIIYFPTNDPSDSDQYIAEANATSHILQNVRHGTNYTITLRGVTIAPGNAITVLTRTHDRGMNL